MVSYARELSVFYNFLQNDWIVLFKVVSGEKSFEMLPFDFDFFLSYSSAPALSPEGASQGPDLSLGPKSSESCREY